MDARTMRTAVAVALAVSHARGPRPWYLVTDARSPITCVLTEEMRYLRLERKLLKFQKKKCKLLRLRLQICRAARLEANNEH